MMNPSLPGWKIECVGDDIAWMKFDEQGMEIVLCMDKQGMDLFYSPVWVAFRCSKTCCKILDRIKPF